MNWVDLLILAALGLAVWSGFARGALLQVFSWGGFIVGLVIGSVLAPVIVEWFDPKEPSTKAFVGLGVFLGVAFIVEALVAAVGALVRRKITHAGIRRTDQVVGTFVAAILGLVGAWFLGATLRRGPSPELARAVKGSAILTTIDRIFPRPPGLLAEIGRFLDRSGFPDVFAQLNPSLAPGVDPPPDALARDREVLAAAEGTYKIESRGCGGLVDGSGFPLDDRHVVTAAHVVAGTKGTRVIDPGGGSLGGTVVYIDTDLDIAVVRVGEAPARVLELDARTARRGTDGAAIGYPGGGRRTISVARVRAKTPATGRDIYSRRLVTREIYVLAAKVRQGNSGGPFVDTDGAVRGLIFAASADNPNEAYALTGPLIQKAFDAARRRTGSVSTGRCAL